jgi:hypothetical protein
MFVMINPDENQWGKWFHHGVLRHHLFPNVTQSKSFDVSETQREFHKNLHLEMVSKKYCLTIHPDYTNLDTILSADELQLLNEATMQDLYLKVQIKSYRVLAVAFDDMEKYKQFLPYWWRKSDTDYDWFSTERYENRWSSFSAGGLNNVRRGLMGTGYTDFTCPSDGTAAIEDAYIKMENGDFLLGVGWEWYNK